MPLDGERFTEQARRHLVGLSSDLSPDEIALLDDPRAALEDALASLDEE